MNLIFKALFLVCVLPFVHPGPINIKDDPVNYKLPDVIKPSLYDLTLTVNIEKIPEKGSTYQGKVIISLDVSAADIKEVKLHSYNNIKINVFTLVEDGGPADNLLDEGQKPGDQYDDETNILTLKLKADTTLDQTKKYLLTLEFDAEYRTDMYGFYKSSYKNKDGIERWLATTQFESVAARSAFPCFDEPKFKAHYSIKVKIGKDWKEKEGYHVLSNTKSDGGKLNGDMYTFTFDQTPMKLSSYLVAFIVSDFKPSPKEANFGGTDKKPFLTWGQERYISAKQDALSQMAGPAVLDIYANKFLIPFAYPKVDQVGIPDFNAGAMENWGLTTYRERMLFFDPDTNSESTKQSTVAVTAHELAHQWFGDLVTTHDWSDIWLNEGFADYFEYHGSALIKVEGLDTSTWNYLGQFVVDEIQSTAFEIDGLESARPLTSPVEKPDEIEGVFDSIAYSKGGSVIRMWQHVLTEDIFYKGLTKYLNSRKEQNGTPKDLFHGFQSAVDERASNKPNLNDKTVEDLFNNWLVTEGYPVVMVKHLDNTTYNFTQTRFLWKVDESKKDKTYAWDIPISYSTSDEPQFENTAAYDWLAADDVSGAIITLGDANADKPKWVIINNREAGYYRVNYEEDNWNALDEQLRSNYSVIDEINRAQIIDDALSLARSTQTNDTTGHLSYDIALQLTKYLKDEESYLPWAAASNGFNFLNTKLTSDPNYEFFKMHVLEAVKARYDDLHLELDAEKDSHLDRLLRILIASWACKLDYDQCITDAAKQFDEKKINPDVKSIVYCTTVRNNDSAWDQVWNEYTATDNNLDQTIFLSALGCSKNETNLETILHETIKEGGAIKKQDLQSAFMSVYNGNPENVKVALRFLINNFATIQNTYGGTDPMGKLLIGLAGKVVSSEEIKEFQDFLNHLPLEPRKSKSNIDKSVNLAKDTLTSTLHWQELKSTAISNWLKKTYDNSGDDGGDGGAAGITISILTVASCLALLFSS